MKWFLKSLFLTLKVGQILYYSIYFMIIFHSNFSPKRENLSAINFNQIKLSYSSPLLLTFCIIRWLHKNYKTLFFINYFAKKVNLAVTTYLLFTEICRALKTFYTAASRLYKLLQSENK